MSAEAGGPYTVKLTPHAEAQWAALQRSDERKWKKVNKALRLMRDNPGHPGLHAHKWNTLKGRGPAGEDIWTAYAENNTPSAWRLFYFFDSQTKGLVYITAIEPHG